jgi:hypothetical protein
VGCTIHDRIISQITSSLMNPPGLRNHTLMLAETESEKTKWVVALNELHRILKRNNLPLRTVYRAKELVDNTVTAIKSASCGTIIDPDRLVIGTEDGLFCVDLDRDGNLFMTFLGAWKYHIPLPMFYCYLEHNIIIHRNRESRRREESSRNRVHR